MTPIPKEIKAQFEDYAFTNYERARLTIALTGEKVRAKMSREEFLATDKHGNYKHETPALMWVGWKLCLDAIAPTLEAANLWRQWGEVQDRAAEELPRGYSIEWCIDKNDPEYGTTGLVTMTVWVADDETLDYPDPEDMTSPGLFVRMFECALQAAKDHNAARLN